MGAVEQLRHSAAYTGEKKSPAIRKFIWPGNIAACCTRISEQRRRADIAHYDVDARNSTNQ